MMDDKFYEELLCNDCGSKDISCNDAILCDSLIKCKIKIKDLIRTEKLAVVDKIKEVQVKLFDDSQNSKDRSAFYEEHVSYENGIEDCLSLLGDLKAEIEKEGV